MLDAYSKKLRIERSLLSLVKGKMINAVFSFTFNWNSTNEIHKYEENDEEEEGKENHIKHTAILKHCSYNFE